MTREEIKTILELFISWNGEEGVIDIANLDSAVDYIDQCINSEHTREGLVDIQKVIDFISNNILDYIDVQTLGIEYSREFDKEKFIQDLYKAMVMKNILFKVTSDNYSTYYIVSTDVHAAEDKYYNKYPNARNVLSKCLINFIE